MNSSLFLSLLCCLVFISCSNKSGSSSQEDNNFESKFQIVDEFKNNSSFKIKANTDTTLVGKKGVKIKLDGNLFVDSEGNKITEDVEIALKEVTNLKEMIQENISTISEKGILETKGMINIEVFSNGKEIKMDNGKNIEVYFPKDTNEELVAKLYYGIENESGTIEWEEAGESKEVSKKENKYTKDLSIKYKLLKDLDNKNASFKDYKKGYDLLKEVLTFSDQEKKALLNDPIRIHWLLFDDGDLEVLKIEGKISQRKKNEIENKLNRIPYIKPFNREGDVADMKGVIDIWFYENKLYEVGRNNYTLTISKLGWINCDIFIEFEAPKVDMYVNTSENADVNQLLQPTETTEKLILKTFPKTNR